MELDPKEKEIFEAMMGKFADFKKLNKPYLKEYSEAKVMFLFLIKAKLL